MKTTLLLFTSKLKCGDQVWSCYTHLSPKNLAIFIQCRDRCGRLRVCNKHIHGLDVLALLSQQWECSLWVADCVLLQLDLEQQCH